MVPIDRKALVTRHNVVLTAPEPFASLSVGNGEFAYTADITGLQTFPEFHELGIPLGTQSQWGWHSFANPEGYRLDDVFAPYDSHGRKVPYLDARTEIPNGVAEARRKNAIAYLRANPHRIDLGRIGLRLRKADGSTVALGELTNTRQTLNLWNGVLDSRFILDGRPVHVETVCHPTRDMLAVRIESPLVASGSVGVLLAFSYSAGDWKRASDWDKPNLHRTVRTDTHPSAADFARTLDETRYFVRIAWKPAATLRETNLHTCELTANSGNVLEFVIAFAPEAEGKSLPDFAGTRRAAAEHWQRFWTTGGAIDLSGSTDPRAPELERRIVLSQYMTAIHCAGSAPPQETGLVTNSWFGKAHLEMHWWHAAHFALWGRAALLERSMAWYRKILPMARETAKRQGYRGARWPKMVGVDGRESPSDVGVFLIWQQPHPIAFAELLYRANPSPATLEKWRDPVFETAEFMASYPVWDEAGQRYVLGPPLIPAQESYGKNRQTVLNPTYELAYWHWGLQTAQAWRERLGMKRITEWDNLCTKLARPTVRDGVYMAIETPPYLIYSDHPSMLAAYGMTPPTPLIDPEMMRRTLNHVRDKWDWPGTWGWDYPMMAMTAARLGEPEKAIDALFLDTPKNRYLPNGHNYQRENLPLYLPGNGGLLYAVALMAAGWDGAPQRPVPGFPDNGKWSVRHEGLTPAP